jgi:hypothetical protein
MAELQGGNLEAYSQQKIAKNRTFLDRFVPWEPSKEVLHASNETVVYEKGKNSTRTRKILGEGMVWGGGIYGIYNLVTLDIPGALVGGVVHVAGKWVRPKEGK